MEARLMTLPPAEGSSLVQLIAKWRSEAAADQRVSFCADELEAALAALALPAVPSLDGDDAATTELLQSLDELYPLADYSRRVDRAGRTAFVVKRWMARAFENLTASIPQLLAALPAVPCSTITERVIAYMADQMAMNKPTEDQEQNWIFGHMVTFALSLSPETPEAQR